MSTSWRPDPKRLASADWLPLDTLYASYLDAHRDPPGGSLLAQTILTGPQRRALLPRSPRGDGLVMLDVGTGFGPLVFEAAHAFSMTCVGIDTDIDVLSVASGFRDELAPWFHAGASVRFERGDVAALELADESVDLCTARLLFQHLANPAGAAAELARVLRPGGFVEIYDVDDGLGLSYPPPSPDLARLEEAFAACQAGRGGDRTIGRKLTTYLRSAGLEIVAVEVVAAAQHQRSEPGDAGRRVNAARLANVRDEIVERGLLAADEFDRLLDAYGREPVSERFRAEGQLLVVARRP